MSYLVLGNGPRTNPAARAEVTVGINNFAGFEANVWAHSFCQNIEPRAERFALQLCPFPESTLGTFYGRSHVRPLNAAPVQFCPRATFEKLQRRVARPSTGLALLWWLAADGATFDFDGFDGFASYAANRHCTHDAAQEQAVLKLLRADAYRRFENAKYSALYADGYPPGNPAALVNRFGILATDRVIDIGCGRVRQPITANYIGLDISEFVIEENRVRFPDHEFIAAPITRLGTLGPRPFDVAVCADVLEHLPPDQVGPSLDAIAQVNAGRFLFAISCRDSAHKCPAGGSLHLSIESPAFWRRQLAARFRITRQAQNRGNRAYYVECDRRSP